MKSWKDWQELDADFARDYECRLDDSTPEPLFESVHLPTPKVCLRCGRERATSLLYSPLGMQPVLPLCPSCAADWNFAGYRILRGVKPRTLLWNVLKFKLWHPLSRPSVLEIRTDLRNLNRWVRKMQRLKESGDA